MRDRRSAEILEGITKQDRGLEIAPWFAPIAPKAAGYDVKTLDISSGEELLARALADPNIPPGAEKLIEDVDFVGNASDIANIVSDK